MQTHTGPIFTAPLYPVHTCVYIKVLWGVLSLANSPTPILHSYLFTPYPANGCYAPLHLLHVLDACIYHVRNHVHVKVFSLCYFTLQGLQH